MRGAGSRERVAGSRGTRGMCHMCPKNATYAPPPSSPPTPSSPFYSVVGLSPSASFTYLSNQAIHLAHRSSSVSCVAGPWSS